MGNNVTNETVIRGELELDEGDPFTELGLDKTIANLKVVNYLNQSKRKLKRGPLKI